MADPSFWGAEAICWWIDPTDRPGTTRTYHELPIPRGPTYWPELLERIRYGTADEAVAAGLRPCKGSPSCEESRTARETGKRSKWRRGATVRR